MLKPYLEIQWNQRLFLRAIGGTDQVILIFDHYKCGTNYQVVANYLLKTRPENITVVTSDIVQSIFFRRAKDLPFELRTFDQATLRSLLTRGNPVLGRMSKDGFVELDSFANMAMTIDCRVAIH